MIPQPITGDTLKGWGFGPGPLFQKAIPMANLMAESGGTKDAIIRAIKDIRPDIPKTIPLQEPIVPWINLHPETPHEHVNYNSVMDHVRVLSQVPTVVDIAVMPDACPAGSAPGTIPVGTVAKTRNAIHPGMHSSDVCCSVALSLLGDTDPKEALDIAEHITHFGPGARPQSEHPSAPYGIVAEAIENPFLQQSMHFMGSHMGTQGDGNHFLSIGTLKSTGETCIVTHHGSRKPGALLYKAGMRVAERYRQELSPETPKHNAWIPADTDDGRMYWKALQLIRRWTRLNHMIIHQNVQGHFGLCDSSFFWNEHNFVFERGGFYYHAKGATPSFSGFSEDDSGRTLIPLNMGEPILIAEHVDPPRGLGFAPHGAGRNLSRTAHKKELGSRDPAEVLSKETAGLDIRFLSGTPDLSELPSAYKKAASVRQQMENHGLAKVVDEVIPYGCIMAGEQPQPWRNKNK